MSVIGIVVLACVCHANAWVLLVVKVKKSKHIHFGGEIVSVRGWWEHFHFLLIGCENLVKFHLLSTEQLNTMQIHPPSQNWPPNSHICCRHMPVQGTVSASREILSDASGLSSVQRGWLLVGYLHRPCWRSRAAEGPVVGVVFKGKRRKTQRIHVALEHCLWKTGTLLGKKRLDLKCAYKSSHDSDELHKCAEWEADGWIKWNMLSQSHLRSFSHHRFQFNSAKFSKMMLGKRLG